MRLVLILGALLLLGSCGTNFHSKPSKKERVATQIRSKTAKKLKNEMGLIPFGAGGQMMNQIKMLHLAFQYRYPVDIAQGREILMRATKVFLDEINSNEEVRPYLDNHPFEPKNVQIVIVLKKPDGSNFDKGELALIASSEGTLEFSFYGPNLCSFETYKETHEEALEIVQYQLKQNQALY